jgi:hypothetical protein
MTTILERTLATMDDAKRDLLATIVVIDPNLPLQGSDGSPAMAYRIGNRFHVHPDRWDEFALTWLHPEISKMPEVQAHFRSLPRNDWAPIVPRSAEAQSGPA